LTGVIFEDETTFVLHRDLDKTCKSIATFSEHDAEAYRKFHDWSVKSLDMLMMGMYNPPPTLGATISMMEQDEFGRKLLRAQMISAWDVVDEWFENDKTKMALSRYASEMMIHPGLAGTGLMLFIFVPLIHKYGGGIPKGGSGQLSESLARCVRHHGGVIKVSSPVKEFKCSGDEVVGVVLKSGEEILAGKAVVSNLNIKQMFPGMVGGSALPEGFEQNVENLAPSHFVPLNYHLALNEAPKFKAGGDAAKAFWIELCHSSKEEYLRAFDDLCYGYPRPDLYISICATRYDPTRAPEGKHTLYLYSFQPYELKDGGAAKWDEIGQEVADSVLESLRSVTTNMGDENIIGRYFDTPLNFERTHPSMVGADFNHIGQFFWQNGGQRPLPGYHQYKMPIEKLYLCGPSSHPGGGVIGGGRAAIQVIMEDLGLDFEKVVG